MKRCMYPGIVVLILLFGTLAQAQDQGVDQFSIKVGVGPAFAITRLGDLADYGGGAELALELRPLQSTPELSLLFGGSYHLFKARAELDPDVTILSGAIDLKLTPSMTSSRLYLLAGGGFGQVELQSPTADQYLVDTLTSEKKPMAEVGIGMERKPKTGLGYFVDLKAVNIFSDRFGDYRFGKLTFGLLF